jgi:hypothetical protein
MHVSVICRGFLQTLNAAGTAYMSQNVSLVPGSTYSFSFVYTPRPYGPPTAGTSLIVKLGTDILFSTTFTQTLTASGWISVNGTVQASAATSLLYFGFTTVANTDQTIMIDSIRLWRDYTSTVLNGNFEYPVTTSFILNPGGNW